MVWQQDDRHDFEWPLAADLVDRLVQAGAGKVGRQKTATPVGHHRKEIGAARNIVPPVTWHTCAKVKLKWCVSRTRHTLRITHYFSSFGAGSLPPSKASKLLGAAG